MVSSFFFQNKNTMVFDEDYDVELGFFVFRPGLP